MSVGLSNLLVLLPFEPFKCESIQSAFIVHHLVSSVGARLSGDRDKLGPLVP